METQFAFYIGVYETLGLIAAIVLGAWYLSARLTKMETKIEGFGNRMTGLEGRLDNAFSAASPVALKPAAVRALEESGLKAWIDERKEFLLGKCDSLQNPYDIQSSAFTLFDTIELGDFEEKLKTAAYSFGWSLQIMRRIGGIYFRDICLKENGYSPEDLDRPVS